MNQSRERNHSKQVVRLQACIVVLAVSIVSCTDHGITGSSPEPFPPSGTNHPGFDTSIYPGDAAMTAWLKPGSPYEWVGYYLQAPCHRDPSWMGKRATLTSIGWGLAVLYVGQQTFDGVPSINVPAIAVPSGSQTLIKPPAARAGIMVAATAADIQAGAVTCSRTLLTTEQGSIDGIDAVSKTAAEGFPLGSVIYLDIEHMDAIPASMDAYYRAWVQQVLADGRFRPGIYVHKANADAIYAGVRRAYTDMNASGSAIFWVTSSSGFSMDKSPQQVGFPWASIWQGMLEVNQTWNGATLNIDVDIAAMISPSSP